MVVDKVLAWFRQALQISINKNGWPETVPTFDNIDKNSSVGLAWFSDTILLFTREDTDECLRELLQTVEWLLFATINTPTTRIRAGIAYGDAFIDQKNAMYVGEPIIDAYLLEKQQQWSGAALTKSASERVPELARKGGIPEWPILPYNVPLKNNKTFFTLAVNWTCGIHDQLPFYWLGKNEEPTSEDWLSRPSVCEKWQNTRQFHLDVCDQCREIWGIWGHHTGF
ncbi:MAG: hypothetical protein NTY86_14515 [Deltaproteobacteria bacterium]|nr:hypothetical protein [Deltaproteobacteria bacterium]